MSRPLVSTIVGYEQDGRVLELVDTLRNCKSAGLNPRIFLSRPPAGKEQSRINQKRARDWAMRQGADLLFLEDDLIFNNKLFNYFFNETMLHHRDDVVFFYSHDSFPAFHLLFDNEFARVIKDVSKKIDVGFYDFVSYERLHFGQAVYIPNRVLHLMSFYLRLYARRTGGELLPTDALLSHTLTKIRHTKKHVNAYVTLPHPVQHRHVRSGRESENEGSDKSKISFTFKRGLRLVDSWV